MLLCARKARENIVIILYAHFKSFILNYYFKGPSPSETSPSSKVLHLFGALSVFHIAPFQHCLDVCDVEANSAVRQETSHKMIIMDPPTARHTVTINSWCGSAVIEGCKWYQELPILKLKLIAPVTTFIKDFFFFPSGHFSKKKKLTKSSFWRADNKWAQHSGLATTAANPFIIVISGTGNFCLVFQWKEII